MKIRGLHSILCIAVLVMATCAAAAQDRVVLESATVRLVLTPSGYAVSLVDKTSGQECLDTLSAPLPLCTLTQNRPYDNENFLMYPAKPKVFPSNRISYDGQSLYVEFENTADIAVIGVNICDDYIAFSLDRIDYRMEKIGVKRRTEIDALTFLQFPVRRREHFGEWLNVTWDDESGVCVMGTDPRTRIDSYSDRVGLVLWAGSDADVSLTGAGAALVVGSKKNLLDRIDAMERDFDLPRGVQSRRGDSYPCSYYELRDVTLANIDEHIENARLGGFRTIVVYYPDFAYTCGHFLWNENYPEGLEDLKKITSRIREAGMIPGFHIHYSKVSIDDPYICSGIPDARVNYPLTLLLAADISADDTQIEVDGFVQGLYTEDGRRIVRIGDELIEYGSFTTQRPYLLKGCRRAALGTKASAHNVGSDVRLLDVDTWPRFVRVDQNTALQDEISENLAEIYNEAGFEFVYFDGAEDVNQPYWYNVSRAQMSVYEKLDPKPLFSEGALKSHFGWHILSRGNAFDLFRPEDIRTAMDRYTLPCAQRISDDFTSVNFGWVDYLAPGEGTIGMQPDMYEYICSKALAWDSPISVMGKLDEMRKHPRSKDNFEVMKRWEDAKLEVAFTQDRKEMLKDPDREFILLYEKGKPCIYEYEAAIQRDDIRAFSFRRDGRTCLVYWAPGKTGRSEILLPYDYAKTHVRVTDLDGKKVKTAKRSEFMVIPLSERRIIETDLDRDEIIKLLSE